jgi:hypothetical protein
MESCSCRALLCLPLHPLTLCITCPCLYCSSSVVAKLVHNRMERLERHILQVCGHEEGPDRGMLQSYRISKLR